MNKTTRISGILAASAAAGAMMIAPAVAHADGTKDPKYNHPPTKSQPKGDDDGAAPINNKRAPLQKCPGGSQSGGYSSDPSYYPYELGKSGAPFVFTYDTVNIPDKFDVLYQGKVIASTGWRGSESANDNNHPLKGIGQGSLTVNVPKGRSTQIEVRVTTDISGTAWEFKVACPA